MRLFPLSLNNIVVWHYICICAIFTLTRIFINNFDFKNIHIRNFWKNLNSKRLYLMFIFKKITTMRMTILENKFVTFKNRKYVR